MMLAPANPAAERTIAALRASVFRMRLLRRSVEGDRPWSTPTARDAPQLSDRHLTVFSDPSHEWLPASASSFGPCRSPGLELEAPGGRGGKARARPELHDPLAVTAVSPAESPELAGTRPVRTDALRDPGARANPPPLTSGVVVAVMVVVASVATLWNALAPLLDDHASSEPVAVPEMGAERVLVDHDRRETAMPPSGTMADHDPPSA
jgi:hypothetical protein